MKSEPWNVGAFVGFHRQSRARGKARGFAFAPVRLQTLLTVLRLAVLKANKAGVPKRALANRLAHRQNNLARSQNASFTHTMAAREGIRVFSLIALLSTASARSGGKPALSRRAVAASFFAVVVAGPLAPTTGGLRPGPPAARASYSLYKAASDERSAKLKEGTWKQGRDIDDASFQGLGARNEAEKLRAFKYSRANKAGNAGKFCAGQTSNVSPMMENICVRVGSTKADQATQIIDEFGSAQQANRNRQ